MREEQFTLLTSVQTLDGDKYMEMMDIQHGFIKEKSNMLDIKIGFTTFQVPHLT